MGKGKRKKAGSLRPAVNVKLLEELYGRYDSREWVHPDPLEFLYLHDDVQEREVVGFIASSLAYGRVEQILKSVRRILDLLGPSPLLFIMNTRPKDMIRPFSSFKHRFTTGTEIVEMLLGIRRVLERYGSMERCLLNGMNGKGKDILSGASFLMKEMTFHCTKRCNSLMPLPERGSACKRLNLFLRWMVRRDNVDPGGWDGVSPSTLIVPLDIHMHRICGLLGLSQRRNADLATALEITGAFKKLCPGDPVRYDFALTRLGIRKDSDLDAFLEKCSGCV